MRGSQKWEDPRGQCCWEGRHLWNALLAVLTRQIFILHVVLVLWRVHAEVRVASLWLYAALLLPLVAESVVVLIRRRGIEWKWFQWGVLFYLLAIIPPVWKMELFLHEQYHNEMDKNATGTSHAESSPSAADIRGSHWTIALEQSILIVIIISRWIMPKGDLTRNQLSSLLINQVGIASDILDFLAIIAEDSIVESKSNFIYTILAVWSWSMVQFSFVVTATKEEVEDDLDDIELDLLEQERSRTNQWRAKFNNLDMILETEGWAVFVFMLMQDGPYFIIRSIAICEFGVRNYSQFFFTCKNAGVLILQVYRIVVLVHGHSVRKKEKRQEKEKKVRMKQLYEQVVWEQDNFHTADTLT